jgi:pimeloyl-ACP methyl ester carboxylesterase
MGADRNMYSGPWCSLSNAIFLDWPAYRGEKSISAMAQRIVLEQRISPGSILIGSSLGGIIACEIANQLNLGGLILIGSAKQRGEVNALLKALHPLIDLTPIKFLQCTTGKLPSELVQMFAKSDHEFIRAMCKAVFSWDGLKSTQITLIRIHGTKDHVIPLPSGIHYALDGGHLLAITNAAECVKIVEAAIRNICSN